MHDRAPTMLDRSRLVGCAVVAAGLAVALLIVPYQTYEVSGAPLQPATIPMLCGFAIAACGLLVAWRTQPDGGEAVLRPLFGILTLISATYLGTRYLGYGIMAPALMLALMLHMGERRPVWLVIGGAVVPAAIWLLFGVLLERPLP